MKLPKLKSQIALIITPVLAMSLMSGAFAVSSSNSGKIKDFYLKPSKGKVLSRADVSRAIRQHFTGVRPKIVRRVSSGRANCFDVKFIYKNELKRASFNCTSTKLAMRAKY